MPYIMCLIALGLLCWQIYQGLYVSSEKLASAVERYPELIEWINSLEVPIRNYMLNGHIREIVIARNLKKKLDLQKQSLK